MVPKTLRILAIVLALAGLGYAFRGRLLSILPFATGTPAAEEKGVSLSDLPQDAVTVVARGLEVPWALAWLPDGDLLVTERPGRIVRIGAERRSYRVDGVRHAGEGGLMGLALDPRFQETGWIYLAFTAAADGGLENRVVRYRLGEGGLSERTVILDGIPGAFFHDGGRIAFGPDGHLYVTTGDAGAPDRAQDRGSLAGKILRLTADGEAVEDNPFGNRVYSYGHRNPQGLAWDDAGRLWATEHGRSGLGSGFDELNLIERGANYGWPTIQGDESRPGMARPVRHSGPSRTWAPAGIAYVDGHLFFGGLRGEALYGARLEGARVVQLRAHFHGELGRVRAVAVGPDGMLYFTTSNRDGRGRVRDGDDRILRVDPGALVR